MFQRPASPCRRVLSRTTLICTSHRAWPSRRATSSLWVQPPIVNCKLTIKRSNPVFKRVMIIILHLEEIISLKHLLWMAVCECVCVRVCLFIYMLEKSPTKLTAERCLFEKCCFVINFVQLGVAVAYRQYDLLMDVTFRRFLDLQWTKFARWVLFYKGVYNYSGQRNHVCDGQKRLFSSFEKDFCIWHEHTIFVVVFDICIVQIAL